jgi:PPP family 3-phenylpropionic acid transporter
MNALKFSIFFQLAAVSSAVFLPVYWKQYLQLDDPAVGHIAAWSTALAVLSPLMMAIASERFAIERCIRFCFMGFSLAAALLLLLHDLWAQTLLMGVLEFSKWGFFTLVPVVVLRSIKGDIGSTYGRYRRFGSIGFLLASLVVGLLSRSFTAALIPLVVAGCGAIASVPFWKIEESSPLTHGGVRYIQLFRNSKTLPLCLVVFAITSFYPLHMTYLPLRIQQLGGTSTDISVFVCIWGFSATIGLPIMGRFCDQLRPHWPFYIVSIAAALRVGLYAVPTESISSFYAIELLHFVTWVLFDTALARYLRLEFSAHELAKIQALTAISTAVGIATGSASAALVMSHYSLRTAFIVCSLFPLLAFLATPRLGHYLNRQT